MASMAFLSLSKNGPAFCEVEKISAMLVRFSIAETSVVGAAAASARAPKKARVTFILKMIVW